MRGRGNEVDLGSLRELHVELKLVISSLNQNVDLNGALMFASVSLNGRQL